MYKVGKMYELKKSQKSVGSLTRHQNMYILYTEVCKWLSLSVKDTTCSPCMHLAFLQSITMKSLLVVMPQVRSVLFSL